MKFELLESYERLCTSIPLTDVKSIVDGSMLVELQNLQKPLIENLEPSTLRRDQGKLLVCHDMRGNYLNDVSSRGDAFGNAFQMTDFSCVDSFCYFAHHLICVPPVQWINVSHRHGTRIFGTILTEWEAGKSVCKQLFASAGTAAALTAVLLCLAEIYQLDGWLINIENTLDNKTDIPIVIDFLQQLTAGMRARGAQVLWYDAVTMEGKLRWQNKLNKLNLPFFQACDGIFINYGWTADVPVVSALYAGIGRRYDVYFGIDCWGIYPH